MFSYLLRLFKRKESLPPSDTDLRQVTADASRCIQCGICNHNCPVGIEVREYARRGENVTDSRCIGCGVCVERCPRGTVNWGPAILIRADNTLEVNSVALPKAMALPPRRIT